MEKNGTPASPATARANSVLPVPGGPINSTPLGTRPPRRVNFSGFFRNSTISCRSFLTFSNPATSLKVIGLLAGFFVSLGRAFAEAGEDSAAEELIARAAEHDPQAGEQQQRHKQIDEQAA